MTKQKRRIGVYSGAPDWSWDEFATNVIKWDLAIGAYKDTATVELSGYSDERGTLDVYYYREETDAEYEVRQHAEAESRRMREVRERQQYESLRAKYGNQQE